MRVDSVVLWSRSVLLPVVLAIVASEGGSHGYQIARAMEEAGLRRPVDGALYPLLHAAEAAGLLDSFWQKGDKKPDRLVFRITVAGRDRLLVERDKWSTFTRDVDLLLMAGISAAVAADEFPNAELVVDLPSA